MKKSDSDEIIFSQLDNDNDAFVREFINKLKIEEPVLSEDEKKRIRKKIDQGVRAGKAKKKRFTRIWLRTAAAAVVTGLLAGSWLYYISNNKPTEIDYLSVMGDAQPSQSGNVSLILSDDKVVDIQNDSSHVVYDPAGKVNINSQPVEDAGHDSDKPALNRLIVPYGKTTSLTLSDGTRIWVNSGTKLAYPSVFAKDKREIFLSGEVFLDVAKNENCPFIVKTGRMDVNVLGTKLNVSAYGDEAVQSVVLVSGAVNVNGKDLKDAYNIQPNQMLSYSSLSNQVDIQQVDVNRYISWMHGYLLLQSESLNQTLQKLGRHYNIAFAYNAADFETIYVSGKLDLKETPENALKYISLTTPIRYEISDNGIKIELLP